MISKITYWTKKKYIKKVFSAKNWNNEKKEKKKEWWIINGKYENCWDYLRKTGLLFEFKYVENILTSLNKKNLKVLDLAAGTGWASCLLSKIKNISEVHAVEISLHRLRLFEESAKMFGAEAKKIKRYYGSFYKTKFKDSSMDIIFMSQAFHHANQPLSLLIECNRVLKEEGIIILIGEHYFTIFHILAGFARYIINNKKFSFDFYKIFPPDPEWGDQYYKLSDYKLLFRLINHEFICKKIGIRRVIFLSKKKKCLKSL